MSTRGNPKTTSARARSGTITASAADASMRAYERLEATTPGAHIDASPFQERATADRVLARLGDNAAAARMFEALRGQYVAGDFHRWGETPRDIVAQLLDQWIQMNEGTPEGWQVPLQTALQQAAEQEFHVRGTQAASADAATLARDTYGQHVDGMRAILRAMYDETQDALKRAHVTSVVVFRGMSLHTGPRPTAALVSASLNAAVPTFQFNDERRRTYALRVPASRVVSFARTGFGMAMEQEAVIIGGTDDWQPFGKWHWGNA